MQPPRLYLWKVAPPVLPLLRVVLHNKSESNHNAQRFNFWYFLPSNITQACHRTTVNLSCFSCHPKLRNYHWPVIQSPWIMRNTHFEFGGWTVPPLSLLHLLHLLSVFPSTAPRPPSRSPPLSKPWWTPGTSPCCVGTPPMTWQLGPDNPYQPTNHYEPRGEFLTVGKSSSVLLCLIQYWLSDFGWLFPKSYVAESTTGWQSNRSTPKRCRCTTETYFIRWST